MCNCTTATYDSNTGVVAISTANPNLNGTGTMGTVITASGNGTFISYVTVKAIGNTTQGMVRLFINDGSNIRLFMEIRIPANIQTAVSPAFGITVPIGFTLESGYSIDASTENAESFIVTAYGQTWTNCSC